MRFLSYQIILLLSAGSLYGQTISSYDLMVEIEVESGKLIVSSTIDADFEDKDSMVFVLWRSTAIQSISSDNKSLQYTFDTASPSPVPFIPGGSPLVIFKPDGKTGGRNITFNYVCDMSGLSGWAKAFSDEWIELNLYSGWFPVCWDSRNFTARINLVIEDDYLVTGSGLVDWQKGEWVINQPWKSGDIVLIASKNLKTRRFFEDDMNIEVVYSSLTNEEADSVLIECKFISELYQSFFGKADSTYLKFVIIPYGLGGYGRVNFATLRTDRFNDYTRRGIAHEMAHFWWSNANAASWEDWLNEAFAEYSMLMYVRDRLGNEAFKNWIEKYRENAHDTPPIWGIDRNSPEAYTVLYEKGALLLYELELRLGQYNFMSFLRLTLENEVKTTAEMLALVEKALSNSDRIWLEEQLRDR